MSAPRLDLLLAEAPQERLVGLLLQLADDDPAINRKSRLGPVLPRRGPAPGGRRPSGLELPPTWESRALYDLVADMLAEGGRLPAVAELRADGLQSLPDATSTPRGTSCSGPTPRTCRFTRLSSWPPPAPRRSRPTPSRASSEL